MALSTLFADLKITVVASSWSLATRDSLSCALLGTRMTVARKIEENHFIVYSEYRKYVSKE